MPTESIELGAPGLYHFMRLCAGEAVRFHLRVDPDGAGMLMANASEAAHLSPVGVTMVHAALEGMDDGGIIEEVRRSFTGGSVERVTADLQGVRTLLRDLTTPGDNYPITNFGGAHAAPDERRLLAPFQAHVAQGESLDDTAHVLRALWEAGVPHVTIVARAGRTIDLPRLVECAEDIGMIAGVRAAARWLSEGAIRDAGMAGLDYLTLVLASARAEAHDALLGSGDLDALVRAVSLCHDLELCPVAQIPLTDGTVDELEETVEFASEQRIHTFIFFAIACLDGEEAADAAGALPARALPQVAAIVTECAEDIGARFLWAPPVRFALGETLANHVLAGPRASGEASIRVEADGTVYPSRGPRSACGNLIRDSWRAIWTHQAFRRYRESVEAPTRCGSCPDLELCAAACPKDPGGWSDDTLEGDAR